MPIVQPAHRCTRGPSADHGTRVVWLCGVPGSGRARRTGKSTASTLRRAKPSGHSLLYSADLSPPRLCSRLMTAGEPASPTLYFREPMSLAFFLSGARVCCAAWCRQAVRRQPRRGGVLPGEHHRPCALEVSNGSAGAVGPGALRRRFHTLHWQRRLCRVSGSAG